MKSLADHINTINNQTVLVRCNFDVPIENGQVQDTTRIEDAVPTLKLLLEHQNRLLLLAHYDRPDGKPDIEKTLKPVSTILQQLLNQPVYFSDYQQDFRLITYPQNQTIVLLENLRFWPQEEANDTVFAQHLASLGQIYVNEAFANCHRKHASIISLAQALPSYAGLSLNREIEVLDKTRHHPDKPLVIVIGGSKLETKEPLIQAFADKANHILVGGKSAVDLHDKTELHHSNVIIADPTPDKKDITEASAQQFADIIRQAKTVIWNGTMGVFEETEHQLGTKIIAEAVNTTAAFTLIGGGDTEAALTELNLESGIDHISTGGGAMLTFLSQGKLIGIDALK